MNDKKFAVLAEAAPNLRTLYVRGQVDFWHSEKWLFRCIDLENFTLITRGSTSKTVEDLYKYCKKLKTFTSNHIYASPEGAKFKVIRSDLEPFPKKSE